MKKIIILIPILLIGLFSSQNLSSSENYIYSRTYLEPVTANNTNAKQVQNIQYLDGLGRVKQSVGIKASPNGKDIVIPTLYDNNGGLTKTYLPLPVESQNGAYISNITENTINSYYGVSNAYSEIKLDQSPLPKIQKSAAPGSDWQITGSHTQKIDYLSNEGNVVKRYKATTTWNSASQINDVSIAEAPNDNYTSGGFYKANTLRKLVVTDEDGNETHSYTNGAGQKILVRQINRKTDGSIENMDTYYVYDEYGNISYIIPPKASFYGLTSVVLDKLCYQYKYDKFNRLAEKKLPGIGWTFYVYDQQNRPVLTQAPNLRTNNNNFGKQGWLFTKYDKIDRIVYTGFFANTATRVSMQSALNNMSANADNNEVKSTVPFSLNGIDIYYTKNAFPTGSMIILGVNYYDEYPAGAPQVPLQIQSQQTLQSSFTIFTSDGWTSSRNIKSAITATFIKNIENDNWSSSYFWYDTVGRLIGTYGKNHLGGFTRFERKLDFAGNVQESYTYHSRNTTTTEYTIKDRYVYNAQNYLTKHYQQINSNPEEVLSEFTYNDLGQVINKKVGNNLQDINYAYNIRGWLTGINSDNITNLGSKLFAYKIKYNSREGAENPNNQYNDLKVKPKYNGRISEVDWKSAYGTNEPLRRYGFVYDGVNRLKAGFFQTDVNPYLKEYSEIMDYDINGNIVSLNRTGGIKNGTVEVMDDLVYNYNNNGNQLSYIRETGKGNGLSGYPLGTGNGQNIKYDDNGNMLDHLDKGFQSIQYNFLNLPSKIVHFDNAKGIEYIYAADGNKVQMKKGAVGETTDYLGNFQYTTTGTAISSMILANEEGYFDFINNRYVYQYADHLGNIRLSYTKNGSSTSILEENNYYPFGMKHEGYNTGDNTNNKFKYLYNSKELQSNGNLDYGWRQYMPDLGRWNGVDQLAETYHYASPYSYVINNPISHIDPDGRDVRPTEGGWEFTGSDLSALMSYLRNGNRVKTLTNALAAWTDGKKGGDFWNYFGSWTSWGGSGDSGGTIYGVIASDGAMSSSPSQIQELIFTRVKIASVMSSVAEHNAIMASFRKPGRAQMMGGFMDFLGLSDIAGAFLENNLSEDDQERLFLGSVIGAVILKKPGLLMKEVQVEGKIIGLGIDADLTLHRGSGAIIYEYGAWQKAGLTTVDWGKASIDKYHFRDSFREAAENAAGIRFEVTNFNPLYHKPGITNFEFNHILDNPALLQKTTFIKGGNEVIWTGTQFITK